jgi:hypothetical protein
MSFFTGMREGRGIRRKLTAIALMPTDLRVARLDQIALKGIAQVLAANGRK